MRDFLVGNGLFDNTFKCNDTEEELLQYLGLTWRSTLTDRIVEHDKETFLSHVESVVEGKSDSSTVRVRFETATGEKRNCRVRIYGYKNGHFLIEIADIENACDRCYHIIQEQRNNEWLLAQQGTILFEYIFATGELSIFKYSYKGKIMLNNAPDYPELVKAMTEDLAVADINVVYRRTFEIEDGAFQVTGMVVMQQTEKISLFGMIRGGKNDEIISTWGDTHDAMTGLFNKPFALSRARQMVEEQGIMNIAFVMIDLDNFKSINDTYGHLFGDKVLQRLSQILHEACSGRGLAARFGGDEFFLCLTDLKTEDDLRAVLQSIAFKFKNSFVDKGLKFTLSIGVAEYPRNSREYDILLSKADKAVYIAKSKGKDRYIIYKEELHGEISRDDTDNVRTDSSGRAAQYAFRKKVLPGYMAVSGKDGAARKAFAGELLSGIMSAYNCDAVTVYMGEGWKACLTLGHYDKTPSEAAFFDSPDVRSTFNSYGTLQVNLNHLTGSVMEKYAEGLKTCGKVVFRLVSVGETDSPEILISFDSDRDIGGWPIEEMNDMILYSQMVCRLLARE